MSYGITAVNSTNVGEEGEEDPSIGSSKTQTTAKPNESNENSSSASTSQDSLASRSSPSRSFISPLSADLWVERGGRRRRGEEGGGEETKKDGGTLEPNRGEAQLILEVLLQSDSRASRVWSLPDGKMEYHMLNHEPIVSYLLTLHQLIHLKWQTAAPS